MSPERRKRARTKPERPPRQRREPPPPLSPIIPILDALVPKPRHRGRPKGHTNGPILIPCPFATANRDNPCPTYPDPVAKGQVKNITAKMKLTEGETTPCRYSTSCSWRPVWE
jgi:hypothetical protein